MSAQDFMMRTYGWPCFTHSAPPGPSRMNTKLMLPSPTSRTYTSSVRQATIACTSKWVSHSSINLILVLRAFVPLVLANLTRLQI